MPIYDVKQGTDPWHELRESCLVTASDAGPWMWENAKKDIAAREARIYAYLSREEYACGDVDLLAIREKKRRALDRDLAVQRGIKFEDEAARDFEKFIGLETEKVGMIVSDDGLFGASPDRLIVGEDEGLEIKVGEPHTHKRWVVENQIRGGMIAEHLNQVHFSMCVSGFKVWWFSSYPKPYYNKARKYVQHPHLCIRVTASAYTENFKRGMDIMRRELARISGIYQGVAIKEAGGEKPTIHEAKA